MNIIKERFYLENKKESEKIMGCDVHMFLECKVDNKWELLDDNFYDGRNYRLFAILADVRNKYGVAPIQPLRGIPEDSSINCGDAYGYPNYVWDDGHSRTYYTLAELKEFDWKNHRITTEGWVSEFEYQEYLKNGRPDCWSGGVGGGNVKHVLNCEMDRVINNKYPWEDKYLFYTAVKWSESYNEVGKYFLKLIDDYIVDNKIEKEDLHNYRLVFFFDN